MKATLRIALLSALFLGLLPISCDCDDPRPYKINLDRLSVSFRGLDLNLDTPVSVLPNGDFRLEVVPFGEEKYVSNTPHLSPLFTQTLMARSECMPNYCTGFIVDIDSFYLACDTVFLGQAAGTPLNPYFNVHYYDRSSKQYWQEIIVPMSAYHDSIRVNPKLSVDSWSTESFQLKAIEFIQPGNYRFTVSMLLKDGTLISKESDRVHFE